MRTPNISFTYRLNMKLQKYGTRKAGVLEGDGKILKSKKKGKWVEVGNVQTDKAVAVEQPRQSLGK
jgi:hypothetical protein